MESVGVVSSSVMVPSPWPSEMVALAGFERLTKKVSSTSSTVSPLTVTVTFRVVVPAVKVRVPEVVT